MNPFDYLRSRFCCFRNQPSHCDSLSGDDSLDRQPHFAVGAPVTAENPVPSTPQSFASPDSHLGPNRSGAWSSFAIPAQPEPGGAFVSVSGSPRVTQRSQPFARGSELGLGRLSPPSSNSPNKDYCDRQSPYRFNSSSDSDLRQNGSDREAPPLFEAPRDLDRGVRFVRYKNDALMSEGWKPQDEKPRDLPSSTHGDLWVSRDKKTLHAMGGYTWGSKDSGERNTGETNDCGYHARYAAAGASNISPSELPDVEDEASFQKLEKVEAGDRILMLHANNNSKGSNIRHHVVFVPARTPRTLVLNGMNAANAGMKVPDFDLASADNEGSFLTAIKGKFGSHFPNGMEVKVLKSNQPRSPIPGSVSSQSSGYAGSGQQSS